MTLSRWLHTFTFKVRISNNRVTTPTSPTVCQRLSLHDLLLCLNLFHGTFCPFTVELLSRSVLITLNDPAIPHISVCAYVSVCMSELRFWLWFIKSCESSEEDLVIMLCVCVCVAHPGHVWLWIRLRGSNFDHGVQSSAEWHTQRGGEKRGKRGEQSRQKYLQVCGTVLALSLSRYMLSLLLHFRLSSNWFIICIWSNKYRTRDRKVRLVNSWEHPRLRYKAGHSLLLSKHISFPSKDLYLSNTHLVLHLSLLNEQLKKHSAGKSSLLKSVWRFIC